MAKRTLLFTLICLMAVLGLSSFDKPEETHGVYVDKAYFTKLLFKEVNAVRKANGKQVLSWDKTCHLAAKEQARYCALKGKLMHTQDDPNKKSVKDRYEFFEGKASTVGENLLTLDFRIPNHQKGDSITDRIKRRYEAAAKFMIKLWMESPPHKKNMLYPDYNAAGIGMVYTNRAKLYVGQVFID
jgi:uncharacterized protein YkwD